MNFIDILTLIIAAWGAILATYLAFREFNKEKRRVVLVFEQFSGKPIYEIRIVNTGHRPVTITDITLGHISSLLFGLISIPIGAVNKDLWMTSEERDKILFPITLQDSKNFSVSINEETSIKILKRKILPYIVVFHSEGNEYSKIKKFSYDSETGLHVRTLPWPIENVITSMVSRLYTIEDPNKRLLKSLKDKEDMIEADKI